MYAQLVQEPGSHGRGKFRLRHANGTWRWVEAIVTNMLGEPSVNAIVVNYRDVTERKQVEDARREEQNLLRTLIDNIPDRIYAMDRQGRKTLSNTADWKASGGQTMEAVIGKTDLDIYPPELAESFWQMDKVILDTGQPMINFEEPGLDFEGKPASILTSKIPLRNSEGKVIGLVGIGRDITERKQAEKALRDSEQRYRALFEDMPIAIWEEDFTRVKKYLDSLKQQGVTDFRTYFTIHSDAVLECAGTIRILNVNNAAVQMFQAGSREQLIENTDQGLSQGEIEHIHEVLIDIAEGRTGSTWEGADETLTGKPIEISLSWSIAPDNQDDCFKLIVTTTDITERKRVETKLQTSESRYRLATQATKDVIWEWDPDGNQLIWTENAQLVFGYSPEDIGPSASWWDEHIHPEDHERVTSKLNTLIATVGGESAWSDEYRLQLKNGSYAYVDDHAYIERDLAGTIIRMIGAMSNITERKQAEEALHKSEALYRQAMEVAGAVPYYESYYDEGRLIKYEFIGEGIRQITGYGPEEFNAKLWDSLVEEVNLVDDLAGYSLEDGIQRVRSGENSIWQCEHRLRDRYGNIHWVFEAAVELRDENDVSHGSIGTYQDITKRKQAEEAEREQRAMAEALRDTAETLSSSLSYEEVLDHILAAVGRVVPHDAATIMLIDGEVARVVRSYGYDNRGFDIEIMGIRLPLAETKNLQQMLETQQPVIVYDTHSYPSWKRLEATDWLRSNVGAPISIQDQVIGFILLDGQMPGFFTPVHAERLEAFANQAAIAIHNAHLLQQAQGEIAERKQAEVQLRVSEERFRQLADNIQEAFWMTDAESEEEIYMSPAAETIWERPLERLLHEPNAFINSVLPADQQAVLGAIEREKNGEKVEIEYRIIRPNGSVRWVWDRAFPIFDETGKVKRIAGISADITERREAEMALVKSQSRYRELFDSSPISIWEEDYSLVKKQIDLLLAGGVTNLKDYFSSHPEEVVRLASLVIVTDVNKASLELYGVEHKEVLLKSLTQILSEEAISRFPEEVLGLMSPLKRFQWEDTDRTLDGKQMDVIVNGSLSPGYEEDWSKVIVSIIDITERKQAEQQLRKLSRAVEQSASTIVITDTTGEIEYVNPKIHASDGLYS